MICPSCTHENRAGAKFCEECATPLKRACVSCGSELRASAKFCDECGAPATGGAPAVPHAAAPDGARKVVTIVFADLVGSTALHERLDPESARRFMESYYAAARHAVESHGGKVTQLLGDGVKAVFGIPVVAEDDALRAVKAAVAMQEAFQALADQQRAAIGATGLRVAVNTGEVVAKDETEIIGDPVNVAARLQEQGRDGDVVVGESTHRLVDARITLELLGSFALKGRAEKVRAYRVVSLDAPAGAAAAAFVGRDAELGRITSVYEQAVATPATSLAVLVGSPGLGKSRLIGEFARRSDEVATVVTAHCDAAGGATFAPLARALRAHFDLEAGLAAETVQAAVEAALPGDEAERSRIARGIAGLMTGSPAAPEETFFVIRRLFAAVAAERSLVLVIDDLQWAEPLLLDLVEHLVEWGSDVPLLVLVGARPELRDVRAALVTQGDLVSDVITLGGLDAGAATRLAANVVGAVDLPAAVVAKVLATSEGNPLFIGELVRMLVHEGALTRDGDRWIVGTALATLEMPPTIHALLAARIERLPPEERAVLERAAVVGRQFSRSAVAELLPRNGTDLDARLQSLQRSELIERDTGWLLGEPVLRFHHVLIRDAAYRRILKGTRAELHARLADWMEARVGDATEHDETIGRHLAQAHEFLGELGPLDPAGRALGERASKRLAAAGRAALAQDDVPLAGSLLGRALQRLEQDDGGRADLALDWCEALLAAGAVGPAAEAIEELGRFTEHDDRLRAWHTCFAGQHTVMTAPEALDATAEAVAEAAKTLAAHDDAAGEAKAHFVYALALARLGKVGACEAALDQALAAARRAGDRRRANTVLAIAPLAALWGPSPVTRASGRCLDVVRVLRITQGAPAVEAVALSCQGVLEALRGRTDAARRMIASARTMVEELGITQRLLETDVFAGLVALLEGDAAAAERSLRGAYDGLRELGLGINAAQAAALLARALLAQDRAGEAETLSHESEALAGDDLKAAIAWRAVRAEALAQRGEHAAAVALAEKGVKIAAATDALLDHADARLALAAALRAAGRATEAAAEERRAHELWETKGATLLGEQARHEQDTAEPTPPAAPPQPAPHRPTTRRRVPPNAATVAQARMDAAVARGDLDAVGRLFTDDFHEIDHPTGTTYDRDAGLASLRLLLRSEAPSFRVELLATLGASLMLGRRRWHARGRASGPYDVGECENEVIQVLETEEHGLVRRLEVFAVERLGDAITRMYERHAELLPDGPAHTRAATTARAVATVLTRTGDVPLDELFAPDLEGVDHTTVRHLDVRGTELAERVQGVWEEFTDDRTVRVDGVLALTPDALLRRSTIQGVLRTSGGAFESSYLFLSAFGPDGRHVRFEVFALGHEAEALARFDALVPHAGAPERAAGRPHGEQDGEDAPAGPRFGNTAWRMLDGWFALLQAGNLPDAFAPAFRFDDRRRLSRLEATAEEFQRGMRLLLEQPGARFERRLVATRGERLALLRARYRAEVADGGPLEFAGMLSVMEIDAAGRVHATVLFDTDDEDAAYAELDRRYEAGEADTAGSNWISIRGFVRAVAAGDWDAIAARCAESFVEYDHRGLATLGTTRGGTAWAENFRALADVSGDTTYRVDHFLAAVRGYMTHGGWRGTRDGGPYEIPLHAVLELDAQGLILRADIYDDDGIDAALARFAELARPPRAVDTTGARTGAPAPPIPPSKQFANAATRAVDRGTAAIAIRDWERWAALFAADFRHSDRRALMRLDTGREAWLTSFRQIVEMASERPTYEVLATRGEHLALFHMVWHGAEGDVGPSEIEWLLIVENNEHDEHAAMVTFDPDALDTAYVELDARWEANAEPAEARMCAWSRRNAEALARRDWDAMTRLYAPTIVGHDHRLVGWDTLRGRAEFLRSLQSMVELAPDAVMRANHARTCDRGVLTDALWIGTRDGGAFESPFVSVAEFDGSGKLARADFYDPQHLDQAFARFEEIAAGTAPDPRVAIATRPARPRLAEHDERLVGTAAVALPTPRAPSPADPLAAIARPNGATRALERWQEAFHAGVATGDWDALERLCAPGMVFEDRQRRALVSGGAEMMAASARERTALGARPEISVVGTAGSRVAIGRSLWAGRPDDGRFEVEFLTVTEVDEAGRITAMLLMDGDDPGAARREAWRRWAAIDPVAAPWTELLSGLQGAANDRVGRRMLAAYTEDLVVDDHRRTGFGRIEGRDAYVESLVALWDLAPDTVLDIGWWWPVYDRHAALVSVRRTGTVQGGGPYETDHLALFVLGANGAIARQELFELDQHDRALARFAELRPDPLRIPPNAATRNRDRACEHGAAGDWKALRALYAPDARYEDRRPMLRTTGNERTTAAELEYLFGEIGGRPERTLLATAGQRGALEHWMWTPRDPEQQFELDALVVVEVDASDLVVAVVLFHPDDRVAANVELVERWVASGVDGVPASGAAYLRAWNARDLDGLRALFAGGDEFRFHDRRRTGIGLVDADTYLDSLTALYELSPDVRLEVLYSAAADEHGMLLVNRWYGTNAEGGAFETVFVALISYRRDGRVLRNELFEIADLETARARFDELRAAPGNG